MFLAGLFLDVVIASFGFDWSAIYKLRVLLNDYCTFDQNDPP